MALDANVLRAHVERVFRDSAVPALERYIAIPNRSPLFDPDWAAAGHMEHAALLIAAWCRARSVPGLRVEVLRLPGRTPLIWIEAPGDADDTVLLYGHLDKQPEMEGWAEGLGPWTPVRRGDRLYGRGAGDDGYAAFAALTAIESLQAQGRPHRPCLVICLDSACGDYERFWATTSLRGLINGTLTVEVLGEGVHSGGAGGVVPSSFRIARALLSRLEDERSGEIRPRDFHVTIPPARLAEARAAATVLGEEVFDKWPLLPGVRPVHDD